MPGYSVPKHRKISFSAWNIHGISDSVLGNKLKNDCFVNSIANNDFVLITETWTRENVQFSGYESVISKPNVDSLNRSGRLSGGLSLLFKDKYLDAVTILKTSINFIWCKLEKSYLGTEKDIYLCGAYIPPCNSTYYSPEIFEELEKDISFFKSYGFILLLGDLNARTGKYDDHLEMTDKSYLEIDQLENVETISARNNCDNVLNNHGKLLLELCKNFDLRILNGRKRGDSFGNVTFHGQNGVSTVDYVICDDMLFQNMDFFVVKPPTSISDHSQITAWLNSETSLNLKKGMELDFQSLEKLPIQYIWDRESLQPFSQALMSTETQELVTHFVKYEFPKTQDGVNQAVELLENVLKSAASQSLKRKIVKRRYSRKTNITTKKWFDKECRFKRHELRKVGNKKHRDPTNINIREDYNKTQKEYQSLIKRKRNEYQATKCRDLEETNTDSVSFWNTLKSMPDVVEQKQIPPISQEKWLRHFKTLHDAPSNNKNESQQDIQSKLGQLENISNEPLPSELQAPITISEIICQSKLLKNRKASYSDLVRNEMIKTSCKYMPFIYEKLFNLIYDSGIFPSNWCMGLISPIFKSGDKKDPGNYRGICVSSCLGKFFCMTLNKRLTEFVFQENILHPSQIGFLSNNRTSDHIFTIRTLIDKYVHQHNSKIYTCFVDFKKAYDSIWHEGLLYRLLNYGIRGKLFEIIKNLYSKSFCAIKLDNFRTSFFKYSRGVRQGCILSPLLFNLFLNELPLSLKKEITDPIILPNGEKLNTLFYADDLVFISRSKAGLQNCLEHLQSFCSTWLMEVNLKKTKIMIFQKSGRKSKNINFQYQNKSIEIVQEYTYLGIKLTSNGNFTLAQKSLCAKAMRAIFKIRKYVDLSKLPQKIVFKIFDATIVPILTYGGEIWGISKPLNFKKWDQSPTEKIHLKFCKQYLGLNRKASNFATRGELGRLPIQIILMKRALKYFSYLCEKDDNSIVKQAFLISKDLEIENRKSYISELKTYLQEIGCYNSGTGFMRQDTIAQIIKNLESNYIIYWQNEINSSKKLDFYRMHKQGFHTSNYINTIKNAQERQNFAKLITSNHNLFIEKGRHCRPKIPREERICNFCCSDKIEDEMHFLFHCSKYEILRKSFSEKQSRLLNETFDSYTSLCNTIFTTDNKSSIHCTAKYITNCTLLRKT